MIFLINSQLITIKISYVLCENVLYKGIEVILFIMLKMIMNEVKVIAVEVV